MKKKGKAEYLKMKKLKDDAKRKEEEHKIDFTDCPVRDAGIPHHRGIYEDLDPLTMIYLLRAGMGRKR